MTDPAPLLLIPTQFERARLERIAGALPRNTTLCGLGPVAAAARTASLIAASRPSSVVLVGIAGTFDVEAFPVASAMSFDSTAIDAPALDLPAWPGDGETPAVDGPLALTHGVGGSLLLTVHHPSDGHEDVEDRRGRHPTAIGEDMEAWGVAFACALAKLPLQVARGASNVVGDRDHGNWRIDESLAAAWALVKRRWEPES